MNAATTNAETEEYPMPQIEIVSHPLCPHAHRLALIATAKGWQRGKDYQVTYLPYATLRETAPQHSPTGELPVLNIDGVLKTTTTTHAAEYLDGATALGLIPSAPALRLLVREREQRTASLLDAMREMFASPTPEAVPVAVDRVFTHLEAIDADLASDGTTEQTMRMDMAALEPAFSLLLFFPALRDHTRWNNIPRLHGIAQRSIENPWLVASLCPNYGYEFEEFFKMTQSAFPKALKTA